MLCELCKERQANVFITKVIGNKKKELKICDECAKVEGYLLGFVPTDMSNIFTELLNLEQIGLNQKSEAKIKVCGSCNTSYKDIVKIGLLGCQDCMETFKEEILPVLRKVHGKLEHTGKIPHSFGGDLIMKRKVENLKNKQLEAVKEENFELAAKLRDEIKELEQKEGK